MIDEQVEVTKTGEDRYSVFADGPILRVNENNLDFVQLLGTLKRTDQAREIGSLFLGKPTGHKVRIRWR